MPQSGTNSPERPARASNVPFRGTETLKGFIESRREPTWVSRLRLEALEKFGRMDWPTTRDEEWRRSDISNYHFDSFTYGRDTESVTAPGTAIPEGYAGYIQFDGDRCTGGAVREELVRKGVQLRSLASWLAEAAERTAEADEPSDAFSRGVEELLQRSVASIDNRIQAWHYTIWNRGVALYVPEFVEVAEPFLVEFREAGQNELSSPEIVVVLEKGARASVVQTILGSDEDEIIYNEGSDFLVRDAAHLDFFGIQNLNINSSIFANGSSWVLRDGSLRHFSAVFGGMFAKQRFDCVLDGPGSDVRLDGMYFPTEDQHFDVRTVQHHNAPHAVSRTYYKGAVRDEAHAVYQGLIQVSEKAVRTDAFLEDKNLLLSDGARADSIPSLQINTDDVKCSHGSTTGKVDQRQVFYLMSRGYSREEAEELLVEGYFEDLIAETPPPIQSTLREVIASRILSTSAT